jgi:hypothetical protein
MNPKLDEHAHAASPALTQLQGQYLAFIDVSACISRRPRAEANMQRHVGVTPPSVQQMVMTLKGEGFATGQRGAPRSIKRLAPPEVWRSCAKPNRQDHCAAAPRLQAAQGRGSGNTVNLLGQAPDRHNTSNGRPSPTANARSLKLNQAKTMRGRDPHSLKTQT